MASGSAVVMMGVSGSGKTTVAEALADRLGIPFRDADEFDPQSNIEKMSAGIPLTDEARWPWLDAIGRAIRDTPADKGIVVSCSALKRVYRERIMRAACTPCHLRASRGPEGGAVGAPEGPQGPLLAAPPAR